MFANKSKSKKSGSSNEVAASGKGQDEHELTNKEQARLLASSKTKQNQQPGNQFDGYDERQNSLRRNKINSAPAAGSKAKLAKQETLEEHSDREALNADGASASDDKNRNKKGQNSKKPCSGCCCSMMLSMVLKWKWILIPLIFIVCCIAAIYCIPFIDIEARVPMLVPHIPFNYREGPMRPSTASQFKIERLFDNQISGPESVALDSTGNMYMAIEGGFILYAHLNKSSIPKRSYYINDLPGSARSQQAFDIMSAEYMELIKIAELNGRRGGSWRRDCHLDEQIYGQTLYTAASDSGDAGDADGGRSHSLENNEILIHQSDSTTLKSGQRRFTSKVIASRCSKPLGVRLSPDESFLYVVDTMSGLYRVDLKSLERPPSTQRSVSKLIDFRPNNKRHQQLPVISFDETTSQQPGLSRRSTKTLNISLVAIDDLVIDYGAGINGGDVIYLTDASQNWQAISFVFDLFEGRPSGVILRYDTAINQLSVLSPPRVAHVRTSVLEFENQDSSQQHQAVKFSRANLSWLGSKNENIYLGLGAPRLDENDIFDDRPLNFPNGLELTDDKQAILIADTSNKRIIKHYIRGTRRGTSDLFAWTPNFPDNIRRGYDKRQETYWVVGCGEDTTNKIDFISWIHSWPKLKKYLLKNIYLFGWLVEMIGGQLFGSQSIQDFGYSLKIGNTLCESFCSGMMILQYNKYGDVIRSIHSREFPNDISLYSQVNELIDAKNQEHVLYLSSPTYKYVTKLVLPSDSFDVPFSSLS